MLPNFPQGISITSFSLSYWNINSALDLKPQRMHIIYSFIDGLNHYYFWVSSWSTLIVLVDVDNNIVKSMDQVNNLLFCSCNKKQVQ